MPTNNPVEEKFLKAFTQYVDFRISRGVDVNAQQFGDNLVNAFKAFLTSRNARSGETFDFLVEKMTKMKEGRGTGGPPPGGSQP